MVVLDIILKRGRLAKVCVACDVFIVFFQCILSIMFAFFPPYSVSWYFRLWFYESFINVIPNLFFFFAYLVFFSMLRYFLTLYFSFTSIYFSCKWINMFLSVCRLRINISFEQHLCFYLFSFGC